MPLRKRGARKYPGFRRTFAGNAAPVRHTKDLIATHAAIFSQFCDKYENALNAGIIPNHQLIGVASGTRHIRSIIKNGEMCQTHHRVLTKVSLAAPAALVLRDRRIDFVAPGQNAALHIADLPETGLLQEVHCPAAADAALAVRHDLFVRVQLREAFR